jgi:hypothetical protein
MTEGEKARLRKLSPIKVGSYRYRLKLYAKQDVKGVDEINGPADGYHLPYEETIGIWAGQSYSQALATLLHECLHALWTDRMPCAYGQRPPGGKLSARELIWCIEEDVVSSFSLGLMALFADNPGLTREIGRLYGRKK